jgi:hypothetical protein
MAPWWVALASIRYVLLRFFALQGLLFLYPEHFSLNK